MSLPQNLSPSVYFQEVVICSPLRYALPVDNAYLGSSLQNFSEDKASLTMALHESFLCAEPSEFPDGQILDFFGRLWFLVRENMDFPDCGKVVFSKYAPLCALKTVVGTLLL